MKRKEVHFRFHNPNTEAATADYLLKAIIDANKSKIQSIISQSLNQSDDTGEKLEQHSA